MLLAIHIIIAISGLVMASSGVVKPNYSVLKTSYVFTALTILSGVLLIFSGAGILKACLSGIAYTAIALSLNHLTTKKLASLQ